MGTGGGAGGNARLSWSRRDILGALGDRDLAWPRALPFSPRELGHLPRCHSGLPTPVPPLRLSPACTQGGSVQGPQGLEPSPLSSPLGLGFSLSPSRHRPQFCASCEADSRSAGPGAGPALWGHREEPRCCRDTCFLQSGGWTC